MSRPTSESVGVLCAGFALLLGGSASGFVAFHSRTSTNSLDGLGYLYLLLSASLVAVPLTAVALVCLVVLGARHGLRALRPVPTLVMLAPVAAVAFALLLVTDPLGTAPQGPPSAVPVPVPR